MTTLSVLVDGAKMPDDEARTFWQRFSDWMEEHKGDLAGFAAQEGFASVHPGVDGGRPVLRVSKSTPQAPYASIREEAAPGPGSGKAPGGGSRPRHGAPGSQGKGGGNSRDLPRKGPRKR